MLFVVWLLIMLMGCVTSVRESNKTISYSGIELDRQYLPTQYFTLPLFRKSVNPDRSQYMWIFIGGDGAAWMRNGLAAEDPTPTRALALDLYVHSGLRGFYLGRPCTFGASPLDPLCTPEAWVIERYADKVVTSLAQTITSLSGDVPLVLVGYSGGGVLASAIAARVDNVEGLVTVASNLDVFRWAAHHGFTAEIARRAVASPFPLPERITQLHVFGKDDSATPYALAEALLSTDENARVLQFANVDHDCCWQTLWPRIQAEIQQLMAADFTTRINSSER